MVERKKELRRRRSRHAKMLKLKTRLARAKTPGDREQLQQKIRLLNPMWTEPAAAK